MIVIKKYSLSDYEDYINSEINEFINSLESDNSYAFYDVKVRVTDRYIVYIFYLRNYE